MSTTIDRGAPASAKTDSGLRGSHAVPWWVLVVIGIALLSVTFTEPSERAKYFGIFSALGAAGGAIGLLLGGMLTEWASWRWVMYVNVAFAAPALVGALLLLAKPVITKKPKLDIPGIA